MDDLSLVTNSRRPPDTIRSWKKIIKKRCNLKKKSHCWNYASVSGWVTVRDHGKRKHAIGWNVPESLTVWKYSVTWNTALGQFTGSRNQTEMNPKRKTEVCALTVGMHAIHTERLGSKTLNTWFERHDTDLKVISASVCVCVCMCVRACVPECARARARACVCVCVWTRACVWLINWLLIFYPQSTRKVTHGEPQGKDLGSGVWCVSMDVT